jgi:hypothetical protein
VRFEDYGDTDTPDAPQLPPQNRRGAGKDPGQKLVVQEDEGRLVLTEPGTAPSKGKGGPQDQTKSDDLRTFVIEGVIPIGAQLHLNGVRQADTLSMTCQYRDFPFDPRAIRSLGVKFFLGCVSADDADRGNRGEFRQNATVGGDALPFNTIPDTYVDPFGRPRTNLRFEGFADEGSVDLDESQGVVSFEFTDNTSLLIDQEAPPRLTISAKQPIDRAIAGYLAAFPQMRGLSVEYRPKTAEADKPVLGKLLAPTAKAKKDEGPTPGGSSKLTVWDYITDVCGAIGHIVRVEGLSVVVQRARTLFGGQYHRPDDPFTGREVSGQGSPPLLLSTRMYGYGINVKGVNIRRAWRKRESTNVEVRSYDVNRKKTLIVRFPDKADKSDTQKGGRVKSLHPGNTADLKFEVVRVQGINDLKTLKIVAQNYYESKNRNEMGVIVQTPNLGSFGGDNLDPDALDLREGDPIRVEIVRQPGDSEANTIMDLSRGAVEQITALGFPQEIAEAYAKSRGRLAFPTTFRMKTGLFDWKNGSGIAIKLECVNYVEVRVNKDLPQGEEPSPPVTDQEQPTKVSIDREAG